MFELDETILEYDELTASKISRCGKIYHDEAAKMMNISRATFGRILESARFKLADGIIKGKAIRIPDSPSEKIRVE